MGWKKEKEKFFKKVEDEGKRFFQNIKEEDNTNPEVNQKISTIQTENLQSINDDPYFIPFQFLEINRRNLIGKGGFGVVFSGTLFGTIPVAVKKIFKFDFEDFENNNGVKELKFLKNLDSNFVLKCHGFSETEDFFYLIFEEMNSNLKHYLIQNPKMDVNQKVNIISAIASDIHYLHQQKIFHLDLKPSNILVNQDASIVKLSDFGISKLKCTDETSFTLKTNFIGKLEYQAPELYMNGDFGPHSDIYSLGIMMFEIVFEIPAFTDEELGDYEFKIRIIKGKRPNLEQFETLKDETLIKLVGLMKKCWETDKHKRPSAKEIIEFLKLI
jgi:serine/threonine protein kinase